MKKIIIYSFVLIVILVLIFTYSNRKQRMIIDVLKLYFDVSDISELEHTEVFTEKNKLYFTEKSLENYINRYSVHRYYLMMNHYSTKIKDIKITNKGVDKGYSQFQFQVDLELYKPQSDNNMNYSVTGGIQFQDNKITSLKFYNLNKTIYNQADGEEGY